MAVLALTACNQVFDLESTELRENATCEEAASELDEDSDGTLNRFDVCPGTYDPPQQDDDGDGVGNACDPDPTVANIYVDTAYFDTNLGCWTPNDVAHWPLANSSANAPSSQERATLTAFTAAGEISVELRVRIREAPLVNGLLGVSIAYPNTTARCIVSVFSLVDGRIDLSDDDDSAQPQNLDTFGTSSHRFVVSRDAAQVRCAFDTRTLQLPSVTVPDMASVEIMVQLGLSLEYAAIIARR
jgi:hypothetical protein